MYQAVYTSKATKKMLKSHLYAILRKARMNNEISGVTGVLVYAERMFLQAIEGEREVVKNLLEKITINPDHDNINMLYEGEISDRTFGSWKMAYLTPRASELAAWAGLRDTTTIEETLNSLSGEYDLVSGLLKNIVDKIDGG